MLNIKAQMSQLPKYINNIILTMQTNVYGAIIYGVKPYARVHYGSLSESWSAPNGRQLVGQAANSTLTHRHLYYYSTIRYVLFTIPWRVKGWLDLGTAVSVQPVPKAVILVKNTETCPQHWFNPVTSRATTKPLHKSSSCCPQFIFVKKHDYTATTLQTLTNYFMTTTTMPIKITLTTPWPA